MAEERKEESGRWGPLLAELERRRGPAGAPGATAKPGLRSMLESGLGRARPDSRLPTRPVGRAGILP